MQEELISWIRSWAVFVVSGTFLTWACPSWGQAALRGLLELTPMFRFRGSWFLNIMREKGILILFITIGKKWSLEQAWFCGQLKRKDRSRFPKWITLMTALRVLIIIISHRIDWWDAPLQQHQRGSALPYQHDETTRQAWTIWKLTMFSTEVKKNVFADKSKGSRSIPVVFFEVAWNQQIIFQAPSKLEGELNNQIYIVLPHLIFMSGHPSSLAITRCSEDITVIENLKCADLIILVSFLWIEFRELLLQCTSLEAGRHEGWIPMLPYSLCKIYLHDI